VKQLTGQNYGTGIKKKYWTGWYNHSYEDYTGARWSQYCRVDYFGSFEINQGDIKDDLCLIYGV
jgi:hypothetical protein